MTVQTPTRKPKGFWIQPEVHAGILADHKAKMTQKAISEKWGVALSTVWKVIKSEGGPTVEVVEKKAIEKKVETDEERYERVRVLNRERELQRDVEGERSFRSFIGGLLQEVATPFEPVRVPSVKGKATGHRRYPLLHLSDWHFEELVSSESVLGLNSYDIPTACRRAYRVVNAFLDWKRTMTDGGRYDMPELVVALNGDMLTGTLHGLERHSDAPNVVRAAIMCGRLIAQALQDLASEFPKVRVYCTVGNHGRLPDDKKVPTKDPTRSWDYIAYAFARESLRLQSNIEWTLPNAYMSLYDVGGHTCVQGHGNFIKQQMGIVGYGMRRTVSSLAANMGAAGKKLKYAFFGHFHNSNSAEFAGVKAFIGPSLIGTQEYAFLSGGAVNTSAQECYVFDGDLGHVSTEVLYGEGNGYDGTYDVGE